MHTIPEIRPLFPEIAEEQAGGVFIPRQMERDLEGVVNEQVKSSLPPLDLLEDLLHLLVLLMVAEKRSPDASSRLNLFQ